ncbi:hypothetical protein M378DRAFT_16111 [Amanita muscaria Koide BX008]|uniref:Uncharacterized protein n=1 Tax=Amanita muscaria (strain Koide BX008) TaxID=946122 RepID=A0A0C2SUC2_AMAMK|nr:hypothetical protein M378DRAFT_16111 [Amanita muscaria Koide BX008]
MPSTAAAVTDAINNGYDVLLNTPEPTTPVSEPIIPPLPHTEETTEPFAAAHAAFLEAVTHLTTAVSTGNLQDVVLDLNKAYRTCSLVDYESSRQSSVAATIQPSLETHEEERQEEDVRAQSPDSDRNVEPSILSVLDGGDIVGWTVAATALSLMSDDEFKKTILEQNKIDAAGQPTNPCLISVFDGYQKVYVEERIRALFPTQPPKVIYVCNTLMMKDPPTHWDLKMNFREFNIPPPNEFEVRALADPILNNYGIKEDPKIFDHVYLLLVLMSNYLFAHTLVRVAKQRYYDMSFHFAQILINYTRMNPTYIYDRAQLMFVFDVAIHFIQTGGDKYIEEVTRIITAGIENSAHIVNAPAKEFGILHLCPINLPHGTIHVDAVYNSLSFLNQLLARIDRVKMAYFPEYVETIQRLIILGVEIEGIDRPETILANRSIGDDVHLEAKGEEFTLSPGNVTRGQGEQHPRTINTQECLLCGHQHYANECYSRVVVVKQNFQTTSPDNSFKARRVDNFMTPGERDRAVFYSEPMYIRQDGVAQTGNNMRKDNRHMKTCTTYASITKEGRFTPYIPEEKKNKPKKARKLAQQQEEGRPHFFHELPPRPASPNTPIEGPSRVPLEQTLPIRLRNAANAYVSNAGNRQPERTRDDLEGRTLGHRTSYETIDRTVPRGHGAITQNAATHGVSIVRGTWHARGRRTRFA